MKVIISTTPLNGVLTDITLDTGEDKSDVMDVVGNSMIATTIDWLNSKKMSKEDKKVYIDILCKVLKENILKRAQVRREQPYELHYQSLGVLLDQCQ